jgi:plasmid stability protein
MLNVRGGVVATITIRNLDEALKSRLRVRAAIHNRSMEDEARDILRNVLSAEAIESPQLGSAIHALFAPLDGLDLPTIIRDPMREPPSFDA